MKNVIWKSLFFVLPALVSCIEETPVNRSRIEGDWLIPQSEIFDGGPGKDGIPALTSPELVDADGSRLEYLLPNDLVIALKRGEEVHAFAHPILDWHEIINTTIGEDHIAVTYCPLTGTAVGWDRMVNNTLTTFGVSGLLYNSNLIPYDRLTDSYYSQILNLSVNGENIGDEPGFVPLFETTWETLKTWYPDVKVTSSNTGHSRSYGVYPYGSYKTNNSLLFPVSQQDNRFHNKKRVLGVLGSDGTNRVYTFDLFEERGFIIDEIDGERIIVLGDKQQNWLVAYKLGQLIPEEMNIEVIDEGELALIDDAGNKWNIFGEAVEGPSQGVTLASPLSFIGFWFSFASFYPGIEIYE